MGYTVRSVEIKSRWVSKELKATIDTLVGVGKRFNAITVSQAQHLISAELTKNEFDFSIRLVGATSVLYVDADICDVSDDTLNKQVKVVIHPYYLRIDLYDVGNNVLPVPRSPRPVFYRNVPAILLTTSPRFSISNDIQYGTSLAIQTATNLLDIGSSLKEKKTRLRLALDLAVRKSLNNIFNEVESNLQFVKKVYDIGAVGWSLGVEYMRSLAPLIKGKNIADLFHFSGGFQGTTKSLLFSKYNAGGGIRLLNNQYDPLTGNKFQNDETALEVYALNDGRIGHGFTRMGVWFDAGIPRNNAALKPYQRVATRLGYAVTLGKGHSNVDLETTVSLGYTFGTAPVYNQFFAGNTSANFLYSSLTSVDNQKMAAGPVIRSLGEKQGGLYVTPTEIAGGTSYWGLNLSFSIPVAAWARPLIPDMIIDEDAELTLRQAIISQGVTAKSFISSDLALNSGLSDEEADKKASEIVEKDINPVLRYLANRANLYSIKPVIFFDLAQMNKRNITDEVWGALGAGIQLNIVNAKLDIGYMHTLFPSVDKSKGNFLFRFTVQNLY
jgi:hypothetical protein